MPILITESPVPLLTVFNIISYNSLHKENTEVKLKCMRTLDR